MQKVLVVCMGNICRFPTAEAVLRAKAAQLKVDVEIDSAGTIGYHQGNPPDARSKAAGEKRGYSFSGIKARKIRDEDFVKFDWILAADKENLAELKARCPQSHQHKLSLMLSHSDSEYQEIPDPYYGGERGFELVLDLVEDAAEQFLLKLQQQGQR
ncbi:low molecular weight phosphotyrosine protein phosphatase [Vibrio cholerae]|nr:low molecular weight phosphotyrosine protein phosphatase [Vibrio cholerae]EGQ8556931.1 low molecular weight phosphotyrosine protein phosphatase [Vibrio cholerae]EGR2588118.1 low molecular weight phosphotyrosine protein phosphatase [Vibrio cholerae]OFI68622.1 protein-tyrosine-phosphatase [Vibrio cholerae]RNE85789.1 low molecular weight phosphotyrosine protein phosphatase [Vibrio cholerae]